MRSPRSRPTECPSGLRSPRRSPGARRRCRAAAAADRARGTARAGGGSAAACRPAARVQSGSRVSTAASVSDTVSPSNSARARQHLVEHDAERPDVGARSTALPLRLLGRHVRRRAEDDAQLRRRAARQRRRVQRRPRSTRPAGSIALARPKSSTLTVPSGADLDVGGLQVAMDDALLVRGFERLGDLPRDRQRLVERRRGRARCARERSSPSTSSITSARTPLDSSMP